jgi:hypothetical protein
MNLSECREMVADLNLQVKFDENEYKKGMP